MDIGPLWRSASAGTRLIWIAALLSVSSVSTLLGIVALFAFNQTAGAVSAVPDQWPASSSIHRSVHLKTLLVFVHPYCPCSVASVNELATLGPAGNGRATTVLFYRPKNSDWKPGSLWSRVTSEIPDARIVWDDDGREAELFGARTSGYTLLYGPKGEQLFKGGVTGSRGHEGENFGIDRLRASLESGRPSGLRSLVFGCALGSREASAEGSPQ